MGKETPNRRELSELTDKLGFLSDITGLPITNLAAFPELAEFGRLRRFADEIPFSLELTLGEKEEEYHLMVITIEMGETKLPPYNILVVENDLDNFGGFSQVVIHALEGDGRYRGTNVITEYNLPNCMALAEADRVDLIIFDWTNPTSWEVLMVRNEPNSFYNLFYGDTQGTILIGVEGPQFGTNDGKVLDEKAMNEKADKTGIRATWMKMIAEACLNEGVAVPPHFIVKDSFTDRDMSNIVSQKLGNPLKKRR